MRFALVVILIFLVSITPVIAQVNPLGVYVDIDGRVKFWKNEENRNGNLEDTVLITYNGDTDLVDLRNFKYDYLTLIEAPRVRWTLPCNGDPSKRYDTSQIETSANLSVSTPEAAQNFFPYYFDPARKQKDVSKNTPDDYFINDITGAGLNDSIVNIVKAKLIKYINRYYHRYLPEEARNSLRQQLSMPDTMINGRPVYNYLVDLLVMYDYDKKKRLSRVIGYHWDYGVELDSLKYNSSGNVVYISRASIGAIRNEYFIEYNHSGRVATVLHQYSSVGANAEQPSYINVEKDKIKFTYDNTGHINSKSHLQKDGTWLTSYFIIK